MELTLSEIKPILKYIIENNQKIQENGKMPVAVELIGDAGLGKSAIIEQIASELDATYIKLNLAQIVEEGEISGFPIREHYVCRNDDCKWITSELIEVYAKAGYDITSETRMSYAVPRWVKDINPAKMTIVNLDDYSRCTPHIAQAVMELIYKQEYISWKLPPNTHIVLTSNPDNGEYNVTSTDEAQKTRYISFKLKFDSQAWAKWAEFDGLDGRGINFLLSYHHELMDRSTTKESKVNARNYTMFINTISGIDNWSDPKSLAIILQIASGCFLDEDNIVGGLFTSFVANKLDKLLSPEDLVMKDWSYVKGVLGSQLYDGDLYRADIASIMTTRFVNYADKYLSQKNSKVEIIIDRLVDIIDNDKKLLTEDLLFHLIKTITTKYSNKANKLLMNVKIRNKLL